MTPQGVPLLISHLSQALDRVLRAALSWNENKISFLESNAPDSYYPTVLNEIKQAHNLRHEIDMLTATLTHERQLNKYLQRDIVNGRKKSDAMCAMMTLIRTETEAVLRRHNVILSTPGACRKAADLHKKAKETAAENNDNEEDLDLPLPTQQSALTAVYVAFALFFL